MAELSGQGPILHSGATSVVDTAQAVKLGARAVDVDGNEYVYVDFQESCHQGEFVSFDSSYLATQLTSTARGFVGVVAGTVSASDRFGWVMVRGVFVDAWASSGSSAAGVAIATVTTDMGAISTVAIGTGGIAVYGVALTGSPDTCASSDAALAGTSLHGTVTVILSYPFITGGATAPTS